MNNSSSIIWNLTVHYRTVSGTVFAIWIYSKQRHVACYLAEYCKNKLTPIWEPWLRSIKVGAFLPVWHTTPTLATLRVAHSYLALPTWNGDVCGLIYAEFPEYWIHGLLHPLRNVYSEKDDVELLRKRLHGFGEGCTLRCCFFRHQHLLQNSMDWIYNRSVYRNYTAAMSYCIRLFVQLQRWKGDIFRCVLKFLNESRTRIR